MRSFALSNLVRNRARSGLALLGLAASTAGVVLLVSISFGARRMVADAMDMARGVIVLKKHAPDPMFSRIPSDLEPRLREVPGVTAVIPEVWQLAFSVEGGASLKRGVMGMTGLLGVDPEKRKKLRGGGLFARMLVDGRVFEADELESTLVSRRFAQEFDKKLGSKVRVLDRELLVTGIFDTGTPIFDNVIVAHEMKVRDIAEIPSSAVNCFYIEVAPGEDLDRMAERVAEVVPRDTCEVKSTSSWGREVNLLLADLDPYLAAISFVAGAIGALGVVNTMLMSVRERVREIGVLRATGWTRGDVFKLVLIEASLLGGVGGALGAIGGTIAASIARHVLPIQPDAPPELALGSLAFAIGLGALGGIYPAVHASRLDPIAAIRGGA